MKKKRKGMGRGLSLLLCGMLVFAAPLQALAGEELPVQETSEEVTTDSLSQDDAAGAAVFQSQLAAANAVAWNMDEETSADDTGAEGAENWENSSAAAAVTEDTALQMTDGAEENTGAADAEVSNTAAEETTSSEGAAGSIREETADAAANDAETAADTVLNETAGEANADPASVSENAPEAYTGAQNLETVTANGVRVQASFEAGTFGEKELPELRVQDLPDAEALAAAEKALPDEEIAGAKSVDISFYVNGTEVQPVDGQKVSVQITLPESVNPEGEPGEYNLIHEHEGTTEVVDTAKVTDTEAEFRTDSFSTFTITWSSDYGTRARLTVHYVDENGKDIRRQQTGITVSSGETTHLADYGVNDINNYRYYRAYINLNGEKKDVTDISYQRQSAGRYNYTYTAKYLDNGSTVEEDTTNSTDGTIGRDIYLEYHSIFSGDHAATVYFLLTPNSDADSNDTKHWNGNEIAVGLGNATVNLENATFDSANKNVFRNRDGNGDLAKFIKAWPDGTRGATWTINSTNTGTQWSTITTNVASAYQAELQKQLGRNTRVAADDIESITVTPHKISINNGNVKLKDGTQTEMIHIDCTISVVCRTAYHYAFVVDFPEESGFTDGTVKKGDKAIRVTSNASIPDQITAGEVPGRAAVPTRITDRNGVEYAFDGWYRKADYSGEKAAFAYRPTSEEIKTDNGTITFYAHYVQSTKNIQVTKNWNDNDNQDGKRPTGITIQLLADGELTQRTITLAAGDGWTGRFTGLPVRDTDGKEISYTVQEVPVEGYTSSEPSGDAIHGFTITNTHTPETVNIEGNKIWDDGNNQDRKRPNSVTIRLFADGVPLEEQVQTVTGNGNTWHYSFTNLPKYVNGNEIVYTVTEDQVEGYTSETNNRNYNITNSYTPGKTEVTVTKDWDDSDNQDGKRPNSVTVRLLADGSETGKTETLSEGTNWTATFSDLDENKDGQKINYTVAENEVTGYTSEVTGDAERGYVIINTHTPETINIQGTKTWDDANNQDGKRPSEIMVRLRANGIEVQSLKVTGDGKADTWSYEFHNIPKYANGDLISYTITEDAVDNYSAEINDFDVKNSYTPEKTSVSVTKEWDDNHNQDGKRPGQVAVELFRNGDKTGQTVTLNAANEWNASFKGLDMYQDGQRIIYTVKEETVADYESVISGDAEEGFKITNVHTPETVNISGKKIWNDNQNQDGKRPESVTIRLYADGEPVQNRSAVVRGDKDSHEWEYTFENLPKYADRKQIRYTVTEDQTEGYTSAVNEFEITNSYTPSKTGVTVTKNWDDNDNQDGIRPGKVTVRLLADGNDTGRTETLDEGTNWMATFTDLDEYKDGTKIKYTVEETDVPTGYASAVIGDAASGFVITNAHTPETVNISGTKVWDDDNNRDGKRPENIIVKLLNKDNEVVDAAVVSADPEDGTWKWNFTDVPKKKNGADISGSYAMSEDPVEEYTPSISGSIEDGFTITNTHTPETRSVQVTKRWEDGENKDGIRPNEIKITLLKNGEKTEQQITLNEDNHWIGTFAELPINEDGQKITYTIEEEKVNGYDAQISGDADGGFTVINSHKVETPKDPGKDPEKDPKDPGTTPKDPETPGSTPKTPGGNPKGSDGNTSRRTGGTDGQQTAATPQKKQEIRQKSSSVKTSGTKSPKTGDTSDALKYGILMLAGLAAVVWTALIRFRNRKEL